MLAKVLSAGIRGVESFPVGVEVNVARGLPSFQVVGLPEGAVREGKERVLAALQNTGHPLRPSRVTVNLAPADVRKEGSALDLPIAVGLLVAMGSVPAESVARTLFLAELGLDGTLRPVRGAIAVAARCEGFGVGRLVVPPENGPEALAAARATEVIAPRTLEELVQVLTGDAPPPVPTDVGDGDAGAVPGLCFGEVRGQEMAKRALELATAGGHNVLLVGPPGAGKTMLARRVPGILPELELDEALEVTTVRSVAGCLARGQGLVRTRPFRAPHHTISAGGLVGGGGVPRPGEVSLAHRGVLFLDELPEFRRGSLEALRQPLEDGVVQISRVRGAVEYPARFLLVAAMNPCPCGYFGDGSARCACDPGAIRRYRGRVSGPLMDRIDLVVRSPAVPVGELLEEPVAEPSAAIRSRVVAARLRQRARGVKARREGATAALTNGELGPAELRRQAKIDRSMAAVLRRATERMGMSARAVYRVLRVARTAADLEGVADVTSGHVAEAIQYRAAYR